MDKRYLKERNICTKISLPSVKRGGWDTMFALAQVDTSELQQAAE